ncbi:DAK2 domain-containing protein [Paramixta manurensis]|uniref:DAK2 domain-containing protein n=1 Tax=Paramixta manurensis TaxID=2740817 RepID=A0A6M8UHF4_9GAMM|nr:DAK2 domain-containing protein [Erwiniaceae bacterium PD-1]
MVTHLDATACRALMAVWAAEIERQKSSLIELDQQVGDGDLGLTMSKAFRAAAALPLSETHTPAQCLVQWGMAMAKAAPSTMGTLMATGFLRGGKALDEQLLRLDVPALAQLFSAFAAGIQARGGAQPGDKTVVDVLLPAVEALRESARQQDSLAHAVVAAEQAARQGLQATRTMLPQHGKAAVFGEKSLGLPDAGGSVALLLFEQLRQFVDNLQQGEK